MKELSEAERKFHLASCCRWKYDGYTIDDEGLPKECVLVNETNPYLPNKVRMVRCPYSTVDVSEVKDGD